MSSAPQNPLLSGVMPPQALEVEACVLGALINEPKIIVEVVDLLRPELFYKKDNQHICKAIIELTHNENTVDILTIAEQLKQYNKLKAIGGTTALVELSNKVSTSAHINSHIKILMDYSIRRQLISLSAELRALAHKGEQEAMSMLDHGEQTLFTIANTYLRLDYTPLDKVMEDIIARLRTQKDTNKSGLSGVPSGFRGIDSITGGWQKGDLIVVAARPSMGKTAFATSLLRNAALQFEVPVAFFSLEMSAQQMGERLIASEAGIESDIFRRGQLSSQHIDLLAGDDVQKLLKMPVFIDDTAALNIMELRSKARRLCLRHKVQLIIVDYLQLMRGDDRNKNYSGNREQEIASISRTLKVLAKELNIPIIAVSQLSRAVESRTDKRPMLSDLRESGAIEQDADMVLFLYRPEYYGINEDENGDSTAGRTEVIISKHRNGATANKWLHFEAKHTRFLDAQDVAVEEATYRIVPSKMNESTDEEEAPF